MGQPGALKVHHGGVAIPLPSQPRELKHLSTWRKRKQTSDFLSSGERKGKSPNRCDESHSGVVGLHQYLDRPNPKAWKGLPQRVKAP